MASKKEKILNKIIKKAHEEGDERTLLRALKNKIDMEKKARNVYRKADQVVEGNAMPELDTLKTKQRVISGDEFTAKRQRLRMLHKMKKMGKKLPGIGGLLFGISDIINNPAQAAGIEDLGINRAIEDPSSSAFKARERMLKLKNKRKR